MSTLVAETCEVKAVYPHPQADALEFITVKGWPVVVQKALGLTVGQRVIYFPHGNVLPPKLAERLGITKYLAPLPRGIDGLRKPDLRVRAVRLRGEPSYGAIDVWLIRLGRSDKTLKAAMASPNSSRPPGPPTATRCLLWRPSTVAPRSRASATSPTC